MPVAMAQQQYPHAYGQGSLLWEPPAQGHDPNEQPWHGQPPCDDEGGDQWGGDQDCVDDDAELDFIADYLEGED